MKYAVLIVPEAMEDIAEIMEFYGSEVDAHPELAETLPPQVLHKLENP